MSRIYKVTTPTGIRLVDANTKSQAIGHCVNTDYSAEPISSSELYAAISAGATVEKVEPAGKKPASNDVVISTALPSGDFSNPQAKLPSTTELTGAVAPLTPQAPLPSSPSGAASASPNPILAEQQRINPKAVAAAGLAPAPANAPIIPINRAPATPPAAPTADTGWTQRDAG